MWHFFILRAYRTYDFCCFRLRNVIENCAPHFSCLTKCLLEKVSHSIKISFWSLHGDKMSLTNEKTVSWKIIKTVQWTNTYKCGWSSGGLAASSPVSSLQNDCVTLFLFRALLGVFELKTAVCDTESCELSWSRSRFQIREFWADSLHFQTITIVGVSKITPLFSEITWEKMYAPGYVLESCRYSIANIAVLLPLWSLK